jgi:hypothetical protein
MNLKKYLFLFLIFMSVSLVVSADPKPSKMKQKKSVCPITDEYSVGDKGPCGGWIIYKKETAPVQGENPCWRYIEAAPDDANTFGRLVLWSKTNTKIETSKEIGKGKENTDKIVAKQKETQEKGTAALKCKEYYPKDCEEKKGEWFLPSIEELKLMYIILAVGDNKGNFIVKEQEYPLSNGSSITIYPYYWSSSETNSADKVFFVEFEGGDSVFLGYYKTGLQNVRCARYF